MVWPSLTMVHRLLIHFHRYFLPLVSLSQRRQHVLNVAACSYCWHYSLWALFVLAIPDQNLLSLVLLIYLAFQRLIINIRRSRFNVQKSMFIKIKRSLLKYFRIIRKECAKTDLTALWSLSGSDASSSSSSSLTSDSDSFGLRPRPRPPRPRVVVVIFFCFGSSLKSSSDVGDDSSSSDVERRRRVLRRAPLGLPRPANRALFLAASESPEPPDGLYCIERFFI